MTRLGNAKSIQCGCGPSDLHRWSALLKKQARGTHCQNVSSLPSRRFATLKPYLCDETAHLARWPMSIRVQVSAGYWRGRDAHLWTLCRMPWWMRYVEWHADGLVHVYKVREGDLDCVIDGKVIN